jgi:hypothetical protein
MEAIKHKHAENLPNRCDQMRQRHLVDALVTDRN